MSVTIIYNPEGNSVMMEFRGHFPLKAVMGLIKQACTLYGIPFTECVEAWSLKKPKKSKDSSPMDLVFVEQQGTEVVMGIDPEPPVDKADDRLFHIVPRLQEDTDECR